MAFIHIMEKILGAEEGSFNEITKLLRSDEYV
jgi:hypothetical protein